MLFIHKLCNVNTHQWAVFNWTMIDSDDGLVPVRLLIYYLNHCWVIVKRNLRNTAELLSNEILGTNFESHWDLNHNTIICIQECHLQNVNHLFRPQWVECSHTDYDICSQCEYFDGFTQDCGNSIADALELPYSCDKPLIWCFQDQSIIWRLPLFMCFPFQGKCVFISAIKIFICP